MTHESTTTPVIFTAFANQQHNYLEELKNERDGIQSTLTHFDSEGIIKHINRDDTTIDKLFDVFRDYAGKVRIFHYAGHASKETLELDDQKAFMQGVIARLLSEHKAGGIELVFLNGCSTYESVRDLLAGGIKGVIATTASSNDGWATILAIQFYQNLAYSQDIPTAFENATSYLKSRSQEYKVQNIRFVEVTGSENDVYTQEEIMPWGLFVREKDILKGKKMSNLAVKNAPDWKKYRIIFISLFGVVIFSIYIYIHFYSNPIVHTVTLEDYVKFMNEHFISSDSVGNLDKNCVQKQTDSLFRVSDSCKNKLVTGITHKGAMDYCNAKGFRLLKAEEAFKNSFPFKQWILPHEDIKTKKKHYLVGTKKELIDENTWFSTTPSDSIGFCVIKN